MLNLTTIKQVKQGVTESEFYQLIDKGWVLLHTYSQASRNNEVDIFYVMGYEEPKEEEKGSTKYQELMDKLTEKSKS